MGVISDEVLKTGGVADGVQKGCKVFLESGSRAEGSDISNYLLYVCKSEAKRDLRVTYGGLIFCR